MSCIAVSFLFQGLIDIRCRAAVCRGCINRGLAVAPMVPEEVLQKRKPVSTSVQAIHIPQKKTSVSPFAKVGRLLAVAALRPLQASKVCFKGTGKTGGSLSVNQQCPQQHR